MNAAYNALGAPTRVSFANGLDKINRYFGLEALAGQTASYGKLRNTCVINAGQACIESTATALFNAAYDYDKVGNLTIITDVVKSDRLNAAYDALNRLTSVTQDGALSTTLQVLNETYTNDKIGNLTSKAGVTITAPATARYGFESYGVYSAAGQCYCFAYAPNTGAWVFSGAAGVSENGTCLTSGNPPTPEMTRTAFLQTAGRMAITVTGLTVSETYRIGFVMARRGNYNAHLGRTFTLTMGGQNLGVYSPMTTTWEQALTAAVVANAASLQLVLEAGAEPGNDSMALIDDVAVMPAQPHAARAMGNGNSFEYDANGDMTIRREKLDGISYVYTQTWTIDNRLASVIKFDVTGTIQATTTIAYDGDGVRVKKMDPSGTTYYLGAVEVLITGTTQVTTSYYAFGGSMVAMRTTATATLTYLHGDHLGSTSLTTNASGQKVSEQRYKPYGEVRWSSGAGMPTDLTFTSQRAGPANYVGSLMDYSARFYSPALGRFVSADTIVPGAGNSQAYNRYMYVLGNPLGYSDPSGHLPQWVGIVVGGAILGGVINAGADLIGQVVIRNAVSTNLADAVSRTDWNQVKAAGLGGVAAGASSAALMVVGVPAAAAGGIAGLGGGQIEAFMYGNLDEIERHRLAGGEFDVDRQFRVAESAGLGNMAKMSVDAAAGAVTAGLGDKLLKLGQPTSQWRRIPTIENVLFGWFDSEKIVQASKLAGPTAGLARFATDSLIAAAKEIGIDPRVPIFSINHYLRLWKSQSEYNNENSEPSSGPR